MSEIKPNVGESLKSIRNSMDLSLDAVAKLTGVSKAMLGQIERNESTPTISTLWKISTGLKISLSSFFSQPHDASRLIDVNSLEPVEEAGGNMLLYNIFPFDPVSGFDFLKIVMEKGCVKHSSPHFNVINEYVFVTKGQLQIIINDKIINLGENNAYSFSGNSDHIYINTSDGITEFQNIIRYR